MKRLIQMENIKIHTTNRRLFNQKGGNRYLRLKLYNRVLNLMTLVFFDISCALLG